MHELVKKPKGLGSQGRGESWLGGCRRRQLKMVAESLARARLSRVAALSDKAGGLLLKHGQLLGKEKSLVLVGSRFCPIPERCAFP